MKFSLLPQTDPAITVSQEADRNLWTMFPEGARENAGYQQYIRELLQGFAARLENGDYGIQAPALIKAANQQNRRRNFGDLIGLYQARPEPEVSKYSPTYAVIRQLPASSYMVMLESERQKAVAQAD